MIGRDPESPGHERLDGIITCTTCTDEFDDLIDVAYSEDEAFEFVGLLSSLAQKVIGAMAWLLDSVAFKFVLKTDDDSFVCLARLAR